MKSVVISIQPKWCELIAIGKKTATERRCAGMISQYDLVPYKGKSLMFWAIEWFRMSNDTFYELYGFNFNPHNYPNLYEEAQKRVYGERR